MLRGADSEWLLFESQKSAGLRARRFMARLAKSDPEGFAELIGGLEVLTEWEVRIPSGPGTAQVTSRKRYFDLFLTDFSSLYSVDGAGHAIEDYPIDLEALLGFRPGIAYRRLQMISSFHLALHKGYLSGENPVFLLIPADCAPFVGAMSFEAINGNGRPLDRISAHMSELASIRRDSDTSGAPSLAESELLLALSRRALMANYILPRIVPTTSYPPWAKLNLSEDQRDTVVRAAS